MNGLGIRDPLVLSILVGTVLYLVVNYGPKLLVHNGRLRIMPRELKVYGANPKQAQRLEEPYPFRLAGLRYDEEETHDLVAVRKPDTMMAIRFMNMGDDQGAELGRLCVKLISKTLDNSDGVPAQWVATPLEKPKNAGPDWEPKFRAPGPPAGDGKLHPMTQRTKYEDFAAGSSRRRWEALLLDNDFTVDIEVLVELVKDMVELTAGTPTDG